MVVGGVLCDALGDDQMVVRDGNLGGVAEHEMASALAQEASILIGARELLERTLLQPFQPLWQFCQLVFQHADGHRQTTRLGIVAVGGLLPTAYLTAQSGSCIAQHLLAVDLVAAGAGLDTRRIDRYPPQLAQPQCPRHLQNLREAVVQGQSMATPEARSVQLSTRAPPAR